MCLYPKLIINRKYTPTKKNNYKPPICKDERIKYVPIGCGNCIECRKQKAREWQVRLTEELKVDKSALFITLSFADKELDKLCKELKIKECNAVATLAVRRFLERWRKKYKKSIKHWLVTELGHKPHSERIHLHGIIWTNESKETISNIWKYGNIWIGDYTTFKTINYIVKYIHKIDLEHKGYKAITLCSAGIGKNYISTHNANRAKFKGENTLDEYITPQNRKISQPIYYRNKLYTEEEREKLWLQRLNKEERYILGEKIDISTDKGLEMYERKLQAAQEINKNAGFGSNSKEWDKKEYNTTNRKLKKETQTAKYRLQNKQTYKKFQQNSQKNNE